MMQSADNPVRSDSVKRLRPLMPVTSVLPRVIKRRRRPEPADHALRYTRRAYARTYFRAGIIFRPEHAGLFYKADMFNHSAAGMYFESARPLAPKTTVRIKIRGNLCGNLYSGGNVFDAEVVWCRDLSDDNGRRFGVGVAFRDIRVY